MQLLWTRASSHNTSAYHVDLLTIQKSLYLEFSKYTGVEILRIV